MSNGPDILAVRRPQPAEGRTRWPTSRPQPTCCAPSSPPCSVMRHPCASSCGTAAPSSPAGTRRHAAPARAGRRAPADVEPERARAGQGVRRRRARHRRRHLRARRRPAGGSGDVDGHPCPRSAGEVVTAARRLHVLGRPLPLPPEEVRLHGGRRHSERRDADGDRPPLRRRQRVLRARPRSVDDVLLRPVRRGGHRSDHRPSGQARAGLPQARAARTSGTDSCSTSGAAGGRWPSTRRHITTSRSWASRSPRHRRSRPAGVWPRRDWRIVSRSGCRTTAASATSSSTPCRRSAWPSTSAESNLDRYFEILRGVAARPRPSAQPRHQLDRRRPVRAQLVRRSLRVPGRRADRRRRVGRWRWSGPGSRCVTSSRCASTTRARCAAGSPTWRQLGRRRRPRRRPPGTGVAPVHGRFGPPLRRRLEQRAPGPERRPVTRRRERDAADPPVVRAGRSGVGLLGAVLLGRREQLRGRPSGSGSKPGVSRHSSTMIPLGSTK